MTGGAANDNSRRGSAGRRIVACLDRSDGVSEAELQLIETFLPDLIHRLTIAPDNDNMLAPSVEDRG